MEVLQTSALPLGDGTVWSAPARARGAAERSAVAPRPLWRTVSPRCFRDESWSGKRDSNPRLRPWQGRTLPLSYSRSRRTHRVPQPFRGGQGGEREGPGLAGPRVLLGMDQYLRERLLRADAHHLDH